MRRDDREILRKIEIEERIDAAIDRIRVAGFEGAEIRDAALELLDENSIHAGDITSIAAHFNLYN